MGLARCIGRKDKPGWRPPAAGEPFRRRAVPAAGSVPAAGTRREGRESSAPGRQEACLPCHGDRSGVVADSLLPLCFRQGMQSAEEQEQHGSAMHARLCLELQLGKETLCMLRRYDYEFLAKDGHAQAYADMRGRIREALAGLGDFSCRNDAVMAVVKNQLLYEAANACCGIDGNAADTSRLAELATGRGAPAAGTERDILGCRDVLQDIFAKPKTMELHSSIILRLHARIARSRSPGGGRVQGQAMHADRRLAGRPDFCLAQAVHAQRGAGRPADMAHSLYQSFRQSRDRPPASDSLRHARLHRHVPLCQGIGAHEPAAGGRSCSACRGSGPRLSASCSRSSGT